MKLDGVIKNEERREKTCVIFCMNLKQKIAIIIGVILIVCSAGLSLFNYLSSSKIGYIDSSVLMEKYKGAQAARDSKIARMVSLLESHFVRTSFRVSENFSACIL